MLEEFKLALLRAGDLVSTARTLTEQLDQETQRRKRDIEDSKKIAEFIALGMKQPIGTEPRAVAEGFLRQYQAETGKEISECYYRNVTEEMRKSMEKLQKQWDEGSAGK